MIVEDKEDFVKKLKEADIEIIKNTLGADRHVIRKVGFFPQELIPNADVDAYGTLLTASTYMLNEEYCAYNFKEFCCEWKDFYDEQTALDLAIRIINNSDVLIFSIAVHLWPGEGWQLRIRKYE